MSQGNGGMVGRRALLKCMALTGTSLPHEPAFILHTGDISHFSKDEEFDDAVQIMNQANPPVRHVAGEHVGRE